MNKCPKCESGPSGVSGHDDLFTQSMTGSLMQFKCSACGTSWSRRYAGHERFSWALPNGEHEGAELPGPQGGVLR